MFLRPGKKIKQNPKVFLPSPEPTRDRQFLITPSLLFFWCSFSFKHLHGLGVWLGRGSGGPGGLHCFSVGVCCCPSPLPSLTTRPPTSPSRFPILHPKKVFVSLFVLSVVGSFLVLFFFFFFFFTILRSLCSRRNYYILLKKWGGKPRGPCAFIKKQNKVCTLFFRFSVSWVCAVLRGW